MQRFKRILVYVDTHRNSSSILELAIQIASQNGAELTIASCYSVPFPYSSDFTASDSSVLAAANIRQDKNDLLESMVSPYRPAFPKLQLKLLKGTDAASVIHCVLQDRHDLLMLAVDSLHFRRHRIFGDMTMQLLKKCPCPVWVFAPTGNSPSRRILAAVDAGARSESEIRLNQKILELATSLADRKKAELHVLHCWTTHAGPYFFKPSGKDAGNSEQPAKESMQLQKSLLHEVTSPFLGRGVSMDLHSLQGDPSILVPAFVTKHRIDLLVMGTVAKKGVREFLTGNTAESILQRVSCSLLAIKPDGFVCPVHTG